MYKKSKKRTLSKVRKKLHASVKKTFDYIPAFAGIILGVPEPPEIPDAKLFKNDLNYYEELRNYWRTLYNSQLASKRLCLIFGIIFLFLAILFLIIKILEPMYLYFHGLQLQLISSVPYYRPGTLGFLSFIMTVVAVYWFTAYFTKPIKYIKSELEKVQSEIDFLSAQKEKDEIKTQRIFKYHQSELKRYYDQALKQCKSIYKIGIFCIVLGFIIIAATFILLQTFDRRTSNDEGSLLKILTVILGSIGTILTNYIGFIYINMYTKILSSFSTFHNRLVTTHHLHLANCIIAKVKDEKQRNDTLAKMAIAITKNTQFEDLASAEDKDTPAK